jgi:Flp pilus assembly protein TadD
MLNTIRSWFHSELNGFYRAQGMFVKAIHHANVAVDLSPSNVVRLNDRGVANQHLGNHDYAIDDFNCAISIKPGMGVLYSNRAISSMRVGNLEQAVADFSKASLLDSKDSSRHEDLCFALLLQERFEEATAATTRALQSFPNHAPLWKIRGYAQFCCGVFPLAIADLRRSLDLQPNTFAALFLFLAHTRVGNDATQELDIEYRRIKSKKWPSPIILFFLNSINEKELFSLAAESSAIYDGYFYAGQRHLLEKNFDRAEKMLREALQSFPIYEFERIPAMVDVAMLEKRRPPPEI